MAWKNGKVDHVQAQLQLEYGGHFIVHHFPVVSDPLEKYAIRCCKCSATEMFTFHIVEPPADSELFHHLSKFCQSHLHDAEPKIKQLQPLYILPKKEEKEEKDVGLMGDITIHGGSSIALPQETIMWIAKVSNFNVNLQAKARSVVTREYRAVCNKCKGEQMFDGIAKLNPNNPALELFCKIHRHDPVLDIVEGRKFKNVQ